MQADPAGVLTGNHFIDGDHACGEGAMAAGCRFVAGYPITPSTEIVERMAARFPLVGGFFIQMEDEIASSIAILGAAWAGKKVITVTSGPGMSLMMEHIGYAVMTETPCVIVNVQRGGPSTGLPTLPAQADVMQARWGSHGDYEIIALSPNSPQECFDFAIKAFNLSELYRVPVIMLMDECVGHMIERVIIPPAEELEIVPRKFTTKRPGEYLSYETDESMVPEMVKVGDGYKIHITGLTHDERGYPAMNWQTQEKMVARLVTKIRNNADKIVDYEIFDTEDAEVVLVSGPVSLSSVPEVEMHYIESAYEMDRVVTQHSSYADYIFMSGAVADYSPIKIADEKIKRSGKNLTLNLKPAPDIIKSIKDKTNAVITAFALETQNGEEEAKRKLKEKGVDFMVLNYANEEGAGFNSSTNRVIIFSKDGNRCELVKDQKDRIAAKIIAHILKYSNQKKTVLNS